MRLRDQTLTTLFVGTIALSYLAQLLLPRYEEVLWISGFEYRQGEYWRLITVAFVHGNLFHLVFNLYTLHILGTPVELYFGKTKYILILLISLVFGSLTSAIFNNPLIASVGASGIIFGLFGSIALLGARVGVEWRGSMIIVLINFALGFVLGGIDWRAHVGGLLGGVGASILLLALEKEIN
jgi:membrane associated rhomboid family serine protease